MLAARDRAGSSGARAAVVREASERSVGAAPPPPVVADTPAVPKAAVPKAAVARPDAASPIALPAPPSPPALGPVTPAAGTEDTLARLREAKRRTKG